MLRLDHHGHALRVEVIPDALRHFGGQPFLDLQPLGIAVQHARQLGNSHHAVLRQIGDRCLAGDRRHVVFAMRLERNVLEHDDLVIAAHLGKSAREVHCRIFGIALTIFQPRPRHALGRIDQAFARWIVTGPFDQGADRLLHMERHRHLAARGIFVIAMIMAAARQIRHTGPVLNARTTRPVRQSCVALPRRRRNFASFLPSPPRHRRPRW